MYVAGINIHICINSFTTMACQTLLFQIIDKLNYFIDIVKLFLNLLLTNAWNRLVLDFRSRSAFIRARFRFVLNCGSLSLLLLSLQFFLLFPLIYFISIPFSFSFFSRRMYMWTRPYGHTYSQFHTTSTKCEQVLCI